MALLYSSFFNLLFKKKCVHEPAHEHICGKYHSLNMHITQSSVAMLRCIIQGTTESVMVAYTHKYAKV